jgi:hypothetical protein
MGSDFSYADMEYSDIDDYTHTLLREETAGGRRCWVVESVPRPGTETNGYERSVYWVDQETDIPVKIEYYEEGSGELLKIMECSDLEVVDGIWTPMTMVMTTVSSGHRTVMDVLQIKYNIPMNPGYFTTNFLQTGRVR